MIYSGQEQEMMCELKTWRFRAVNVHIWVTVEVDGVYQGRGGSRESLIFSKRSLAVCVSCQMVKCYGGTASGRLAERCSFLGDQPSCSSVTLRALLVHL